ncbi:hypothetical protein M5585_12865 [Serratia ureilytica]
MNKHLLLAETDDIEQECLSRHAVWQRNDLARRNRIGWRKKCRSPWCTTAFPTW